MLSITLVRDPLSLVYRKDMSILGDWGNQSVNNSLDVLTLLNDNETLLQCKAQTVANMESLDPGVHFYDTIVCGDFFLRAFYDQLYSTSHYGRIHGSVKAYTFNGDYINDESITSNNSSRWEWHDWQHLRPAPQGHDTSVAWSAGCIVIPDYALVNLGSFFDQYTVKPGDLIPVHLEMK